MIVGLVHCRDGVVVFSDRSFTRVRRRRREPSQAVIKRALKAGGRLEFRPDGTVIITAAADQTNTAAEENVFDIEAERLRRQKRGDA